MKQKLLLWLGLLLGALFLYIALRDIAFDEFLAAIRKVDLLPLVGAFLTLILIYGVRTVRWRAIIRSTAEIGYGTTFSILMIGFFGNNVLPARAGEFLRAFLLQRKIHVRKSFALGTIVVERVNDVAALFGLLLVALYRIPADHLPAITKDVRVVALVVLIGFVVALGVLLWGRAWVVNALRGLFGLVLPAKHAETLASKFDHFSQGLEVLRSPRKFALVSALSILDWLAMVVVFSLVFRAFGFNLPPSAAGLTVALVNLGMIVPSSPGYVGTYEFFMVKSLGAFEITPGAALAYALVVRSLWYLFEVIVGFACLWYSHLSARQLFRMSRSAEETPPAEETTAP